MPEEVLEGFELSPQQRHLWAGRRGHDTAYRARCLVRVEGPLDREALREALRGVVARYEVLRTDLHSLPGMDLPVQVILDDPPLACAEVELDGKGAGAEVAAAFAAAGRGPADAGGKPPAQFTFYTLSPDTHLLLVSLPALCADAPTLKGLAAEVGRAYAAGLKGEGPEGDPVQYVDYSEWHNELLRGGGGEEGRGYWRGLTGRDADATALPLEREAAAGHAFAPESVAFEVGEEAGAALLGFARECGATAASALLACWQTLLWRLTGRPDVVVGNLAAGRRITRLRGAFGLLARYLPVRVQFDEAFRFEDVLALVEEAARGNEARQEYFAPESGAHLPFAFDCEEWPEPLTAGGARFSLDALDSCVARFKLRLSVELRGSKLSGRLHYDPALYAVEDARRHADQFTTLLASAMRERSAPVGRLDILGARERLRLVGELNETRAAYPRGLCLHELFEAQAARTPDEPAVLFRQEGLSFGELNRRANQLAHRLRGLGVGPEVRVGLCLERSVEMIVALLAVLKAGGAYVPLDPALPPERLSFMLEDAGVAALVSQSSLSALPPAPRIPLVLLDAEREALARESEANPSAGARPDDLAYVIYTSGSTGRPKGVMIRHASAVNLLTALDAAVYAGRDDARRVSVNAPLAFDASVKQVVQLLAGRALVVIPEEARLDAAELSAYAAAHRLDVLDCTPSQLRLLLAARSAGKVKSLPPLLLVGGEAMDGATWGQLAGCAETVAYNVYGPTECTVDATACRVTADAARPSIGRPVANARVYVLDKYMQPVPVGVAGELYVGGEGVARGYLDAPALTAAKFVPDPFNAEPGARLYRTGDAVRHLPDGNVEFLGRLDRQLKLRGYRVEPGEIESALCRHPAVRAACVVARADEAGGARLVAYVVPHRRHLAEIDGHTRHRLPNGMAVAHQNRNETDYLYEEIFEKQLYTKHGVGLPEGACVFDVGANIGVFTLFVKRHRPEARVYAFEPIRPIFETLRVNAELCGPGVRLFPFGLSRAPKAETFTYYPQYSMMSGQSVYARPGGDVEVVKKYMRNRESAGDDGAATLLAHANELLAGRFEGETHQAQLRTLSEVIREEGVERIDLLKVDVQRAELDVLEGIEPADWGKIRQVVMEVHDGVGEESEGRVAAVIALLEARGFEAVAEQEDELAGTDRFNLYAVRPASRLAPPPAAGEPAPGAFPSVLTEHELRQTLKAQLPEHMVPAAFVLLPELPLTRNGKVDTAALPEAERRGPDSGYVAPRTSAERVIASVWQQALRLERVGVDENFFELGGHSLLLVQVHGKIREALGVEVSMVEMFQHPTVSALARHLTREGGGEQPLSRARERAERQKEARGRRQQQGARTVL